MKNPALRSALGAASRLNKPASRQLFPGLAARGFSSTTVNRLRHTFVETENHELNDVLKLIEDKIIFPSFLPKKQKDLVFDLKRRTFLAQNPVIIEVDGQEHKFEPLNLFELPNARKQFRKAIILMQDKQDWANLPTLLSGYQSADVVLPIYLRRFATRRAAVTGGTHEIIECAKQVRVTKWKLDDDEIILRVLGAINEKIIANKWEVDETMQGMKWSRVVMDLLHREEHYPEGARKAHVPMLAQGQYIFTRAFAVRAMQATEKPTDAEMVDLRDEAMLLVSMWKRSMNLPLTEVPQIKALTNAGPDGVDSMAPNHLARILAQNVKGIALARELLEGQTEGPVEGLELIQQKLEQSAAEGTSTGLFNEQTGAKWAELMEEMASLTEPLVNNPSAEETVGEAAPVEGA